MSPRDRLSPLSVAALALVGAMTLHAADHFRQGLGPLTPEVIGGGVALAVLAFGTLAFTLSGHPRAPLVAVLVGSWIAIGVTASHVAPHWSAFSYSYPEVGVDGWSWAAALLEVAAAAVLALVGLRELRAPGAAQAAR